MAFFFWSDFFKTPANHTYENYLKAAKSDGSTIELFKYQTPELALLAYKNGACLEQIKHPTLEIYKESMKKHVMTV